SACICSRARTRTPLKGLPNCAAAGLTTSPSFTPASRRVEAQHADGVAPHNPVDILVGETLHHLLRHRPGVGPCGVGVRVVGFERDAVVADDAERVETVLVEEEAAVDLPVVVGGRLLRDVILHPAPGAVL